MENPKTQSQLLTTNVLSLGPTTMIFLKKNDTPDSLQVHNPWNLMPIDGQNWSNSVFHVCALPLATPWDFFIFLAMMCWVKASSSDFKQKVRNYFIFLHYFLRISSYFFHFFVILAHFAHFTPPYGRPLITCDHISYFHVSWVQLAHGKHCRQKKSMNSELF